MTENGKNREYTTQQNNRSGECHSTRYLPVNAHRVKSSQNAAPLKALLPYSTKQQVKQSSLLTDFSHDGLITVCTTCVWAVTGVQRD